jgi:4-amino-4-deoxy-L-arabinose transferase-like glycosyltransferase
VRVALNRLHRVPWLLIPVLVLQSALTLKLAWTNTAFQDEALYLWAGRLEWDHVLHGAPVPPFSTYFSGAPVLYPPLAAVADKLGGLAGARLLSLGFMLLATCFLWSATGRLYGRRAACFAAALFAVLGPTLHLGAFATFDAMSLCLIAASAWCVTRIGDGRDGFRWVCLAAISLTLANATKYASALFDPVVVGMAMLSAFPAPGGKQALRRGAAIGAYLISGIVLLLTLGGAYYQVGVGQTTLQRIEGTSSPHAVLTAASHWVGIVAVLAFAGALTCLGWRRGGSPRLLLPALFLIAVLLAPAQQARIHTLTSLDKHSDFGAWFGAIGAAYAIELVLSKLRPRLLSYFAVGLCAIAAVLPAKSGLSQARVLSIWPNSTRLNAILGPLINNSSGRILDEDPSVSEYGLPKAGAAWRRWSNLRSIYLPDNHTISVGVSQSGNPAVYAPYIRENYFSVVILDYREAPGLAYSITNDLKRNHAYHLADVVPYGNGRAVIWVLGGNK